MTLLVGRDKHAENYRVRLNGRLRPKAFYADGRRGVVREFVTDTAGRYQIANSGRIATRELRGHVAWERIS